MDEAVDLIAGINGGIAVVAVGQPLDTVKTKMQAFPTLYRNSFHCFFRTFRQEGLFRGLYAGTVPSLVANVADNAIVFLFYGVCQKLICSLVGKKSSKRLTLFENACAGGCSGIFTALALCPIELVKVRLQAQFQIRNIADKTVSDSPKSAIQIISSIVRNEGLLGMYKGFSPTLVREIFGYFFFFLGIETTRKYLTPAGVKPDDAGALVAIASGAAGGVSLWLAVYPLDTIKSRMQVDFKSGVAPSSLGKMLYKTLRTEGPRNLYVGFGPALLRTAPCNAALYLAYDASKNYMNKLRAYDDGDHD